MSRQCSQAEALRRCSALSPADAGRLRGHSLRNPYSTPVPPGTLNAEAAAHLHASLYRRQGDRVTADMVCFVVSSDGTPVAWVTYDARVATPAATLTAYQLAHQTQAVAALSRLTRRAIRELAALRDGREQRDPGTLSPFDVSGRVLVADPRDPTLTWWTQITGDPAASAEHLRHVTGAAGDVLFVDTYQYGDYGRHREVFDLDTLCVIEELADINDLPPQVVGDWLHAEGATSTTVAPDKIRAGFTAAYAGVHASRPAFATFERDRRGWSTVLGQAGIPLTLFDTRGFAGLLFTDEVREIRLPSDAIAVFRRA